MWPFSHRSATTPGWGVAIRETAAVVYACARLPRRWKRKLVTEQIKDVLMDIEQQVQQRPAFLMPPQRVVTLAQACLSLGLVEARRRCLFRCLVFYYLLIRARCRATLHFGCRLEDRITGHCWLSSPDVRLAPRDTKPRGTQEIVVSSSENLSRGVLWPTFCSPASAIEPVVSVLREKKSPALRPADRPGRKKRS